MKQWENEMEHNDISTFWTLGIGGSLFVWWLILSSFKPSILSHIVLFLSLIILGRTIFYMAVDVLNKLIFQRLN